MLRLNHVTGSTRNRQPQPAEGEHGGPAAPKDPARPAAVRPRVGTPQNPSPPEPDDDESGDELLGDRTEAMMAPPADFLAHAHEYLEPDELSPDEVVLDDADAEEVSVDVVEDGGEDGASAPVAVAAQPVTDDAETGRPPAADAHGEEGAAADTAEQDISTLKTTVEEVLARLAEEDAAAKPPPVLAPPVLALPDPADAGPRVTWS